MLSIYIIGVTTLHLKPLFTLTLLQVAGVFSGMIIFSYYMKRHKWSMIKTRRLVYTPRPS